jgi:hypothetical protein
MTLGADSPLRTLGDQVGDQIVAAMAGWKPADVVLLNAIMAPFHGGNTGSIPVGRASEI